LHMVQFLGSTTSFVPNTTFVVTATILRRLRRFLTWAYRSCSSGIQRCRMRPLFSLTLSTQQPKWVSNALPYAANWSVKNSGTTPGASMPTTA
jgi:hypothetical protein